MRRVLRGFVVSTVLINSMLGLVPGGIRLATAEQNHALRGVVQRAVPTYPELARRLNLHGIVRIEVTVLPNGSVKATKVLGGNPVLVQSAIDAVRRWKFEPGPDESSEVVEMRFDEK